MTTTKINQKEYLKKYLSSNIGDEKKKKKKKSKIKTTVNIIDDDIDLSKIGTDGDDMDIFQTGEDAPQIVGVIDDRPPELQALDYQNSTKWKAVNNNFTNMLNQTKPSTSASNDLTKECSPPKQRSKTDSKRLTTYFDDGGDLSLHRRRDGKRSDLSPKMKSKKSAYSPRRKYSGDLSPKRQKSHKYNNEDLSLNHYTSQKDSGLDLSPKRNKNKYYCEDSPKLRKSRRDSDGDLSPKRGSRGKNFEDDLPLKRSQQQQYSEDLSPLRCKDGKNAADYSTKRRRTPNQSDDDLPSKRSSRPNSNRDAVPNQSRTARADSDLSTKRHQNTNYSPKRNRKSRFDLPYQRRSTSCDILPKRKSPSNKTKPQTTSHNEQSRSGSFDLSPPRKSTNKSADRHYKHEHFARSSPPRHIKVKEESPPPTHSKMMAKTLDGKTAGLSDAKSLRIENAKFKEREQKLFEKMTDEMSGRNADVVMRERATGKRRNFEEESEKQRKKDEKDKAKKAIYDRWGAGLKQVEDHKTRLEEISHEMSKPLARYSNDEDLDDYLKKQERDGDPMLEYIRQKEREKNKKRGIPEMPKYEGSFPDNRFNIRPGYRWDGVDRSNGFEKKWFETISKKKAVEEEAYRYSTEDM